MRGREGGERDRSPLPEPRWGYDPERRALPQGGFHFPPGAADKGNCPFEGECKAKAALAVSWD